MRVSNGALEITGRMTNDMGLTPEPQFVADLAQELLLARKVIKAMRSDHMRHCCDHNEDGCRVFEDFKTYDEGAKG